MARRRTLSSTMFARSRSPPADERLDNRAVLRPGTDRRSKFHAWKRRFRLIDYRDQCPALPAPSAFLPVTVRLDERTRDEPLPIEADLPNGVRLRIPTDNPRLACRLVRSIAAARTDSGGSR